MEDLHKTIKAVWTFVPLLFYGVAFLLIYFVLPVGVSLVEHIFWPSVCGLNWTMGQSQKMLLSLLPLYKDTGPLSCQRQPRVLPPVQTSDILRLSVPFSHNL